MTKSNETEVTTNNRVCTKQEHEHSIHCAGCSGNTVSHVCGKTPCTFASVQPDVHEFAPITDAAFKSTTFSVQCCKQTGKGYCGQPKDAAIHQVPEPVSPAPPVEVCDYCKDGECCFCRTPACPCTRHVAFAPPQTGYAKDTEESIERARTTLPSYDTEGSLISSRCLNHCGHPERCFKQDVCKAVVREDDVGPVYCGHVCAFPAEPEAPKCDDCYYCARYGCTEGQPALDCTCPIRNAALNPEEMIPVYWFGNNGMSGPCQISIDALLENDVREALNAYADPEFGRGGPVKLTITTGLMKRKDYDALPEFEGY